MRYIIYGLILALCFSCNKGNNNIVNRKAEADSIVAFMRREITQFNRIEKFERSKHILDSLRPLIIANGDELLLGSYLRFTGGYFLNTMENDSAVYYYTQALELKKDPDGIAATELALSKIFLRQKKVDSALVYARRVYDNAKTNNKKNISKICLRLAEIYDETGDLELERKYLFEGFQNNIDPLIHYGITNAIVGYYDAVGKSDSADIFYEQYVLNDTVSIGGHLKADALRNYGVRMENKGKYNIALEAYHKSLKLYRENDAMDGYVYAHIGEVYQKLKQYRKSEHYLDSAMIFCKDIPKDMCDILLMKAKNAYAQGLAVQAYKLNDSAFNVYKTHIESSFGTQTRELETKYEVKSKDEAIKLLKLKSVLAQNDAQRKQIIIGVLIIVLSLLVIIGFVMFRRKQLSSQLKQIELEQRLLRTQMEPHFIFNSLAVLQSQIRAGEQDKASKYLNQFARLLRASLENSREAFVPLEEEIEALQNYMSLQAMRFEEAFDYNIAVYNGFEDDGIYIPPMLLQPFVENAIHHGILSLQRRGEIKVIIEKKTAAILCRIMDNGHGYTTETTQPKRKSLSTTITRERLAILSRQTGVTASLNISGSINPDGTSVEIVIPYKKGA